MGSPNRVEGDVSRVAGLLGVMVRRSDLASLSLVVGMVFSPPFWRFHLFRV
jgi:hypothetical protein